MDINSLINLAVSRGCRHYSGTVQETCFDKIVNLSNEELAVMLISSNEPLPVRVGGMMLGGCKDIETLKTLAKKHNCSGKIKKIAEYALNTENSDFWRELSNFEFNETKLLELPHISRFRSETGVINPLNPQPKIKWLYPQITR